jgi:prephenate dehydrogenase
MNRIAIIGLGLMGGSLGLALRKKGKVKVTGYCRSLEKAKAARRRAVADEVVTNLEKAVQDADLVVYCAPILAIASLVRESKPALKPGCLLTDVGSTKSFLAQDMATFLKEEPQVFVGSHPMAGSEQQGLAAARADLYKDSTVVVTPSRGTPREAVDAVRGFWEGLEGRVFEMEAREHDRIVARTSHLPHMMAAMLAATVGRSGGLQELSAFCGTGFRDTTRIAEGSPEVWHDILRTNRTNVAEELRACKMQLDQLLKILDEGDFERAQQFLEKARAARVGLAGHEKTTSR